jgi:hypothetical protein
MTRREIPVARETEHNTAPANRLALGCREQTPRPLIQNGISALKRAAIGAVSTT